MIGKIVIGLLALLVLVGGIVGGVVYWNRLNAPEPAMIGNDAIELPETSPVNDVDLGVSMPTDDPSSPEVNAEVEVPIGEEAQLGEEAPTEVVPDIQPEVAATDRSVAERPVERPSNAVREPRTVVGEPAETTPVNTSVDTTPVNTPAEGTSVAQGIIIEPATPTPAPTQPPVVVTPTPVMPKGNFAVSTSTPVLSSQLPQVRQAMSRLGVQLAEQKGNSYPQQAYRVSIGYFVQKADAENWGRAYLRPKNMKYQVYPVQGMHSIQVGVYTNRQNVDRMISQLYQAFPGWRLPVRTEMTTIQQSTYKLSVRGIPESLARRIQSELYRFGIAAELFSIS